ncbi:class I SAM-dependent methyltransferase [Streptomyces sp. NBC_00249]|uniref:class I SAM-dependent methyltransferase n=1 Tax=Streptomyces sp. NBC_00249 TaxID=2975690 RepID=UPI002259279A|nr:methyltransferase domain-containing protein [Streptomyces sp. NBC_00249]MCX5199230.1 class I SAM-dependent methyltransferase [Streptomyces sp. NBC_00249]
MSTAPTAQDWHDHYAGGRDFRPLTDREKSLLHAHLALPSNALAPRALDVACGTGELARLLAAAGYQVDAVDWAAAAIERARAAPSYGITYHRLDVTHGGIAALPPAGAGYRVITLRRALAHLPDRTRTVAELAALLAPGGTLCVITPHADRHRADLRGICLDDAEIGQLTDGWEHTERFEADDCTVLLLRDHAADVRAAARGLLDSAIHSSPMSSGTETTI